MFFFFETDAVSFEEVDGVSTCRMWSTGTYLDVCEYSVLNAKSTV